MLLSTKASLMVSSVVAAWTSSPGAMVAVSLSGETTRLRLPASIGSMSSGLIGVDGSVF
jgi:hypothetical protein